MRKEEIDTMEANPADGLEHLLSLEEKINQTIDLLKSTRAEKEELRRENDELRHENAVLRRERQEQQESLQKTEAHLGRLEKERETVRGRIQKLVEQVDRLTREKAE